MLGGILMQRFAMTTSLPVGSMVNGDNKAAASLPLKGPCPSGCAGVTVCSALTSRSCAQLAVYSCRGWSQASLCLRGFTSGICRLWEKKRKKNCYLFTFASNWPFGSSESSSATDQDILFLYWNINENWDSIKLEMTLLSLDMLYSCWTLGGSIRFRTTHFSTLPLFEYRIVTSGPV